MTLTSPEPEWRYGFSATIAWVVREHVSSQPYAICKADMLIKGHDIASIILGNTLSNDGFIGRLRDSIIQRGTLDLLRNGFEMLGQRSKLSMIQVPPAVGINPQIMARYAANRLRVAERHRLRKSVAPPTDVFAGSNAIEEKASTRWESFYGRRFEWVGPATLTVGH